MMPYYPARDGHPSMFTLDENASAAPVEPIHSAIRTSGRVLRLLYAGNVAPSSPTRKVNPQSIHRRKCHESNA
jgi:hypothetical protein